MNPVRARLFLVLFQLALAPITAHCAAAQAQQLIDAGDAQVRALDAPAALALFDQAAQAEPGDAEILLRISQQCSNLIAQAHTPQEALAYARRSLDEAQKAAALAPSNSKAHLALAVAYGRLSPLEDTRTRVEYSRLVKAEAERALALDPHEDFAYHVLGRWNYAVATLNPVMKLIARYIYGGMPDASLEEAARDYQKAIELAPQRVIHHHELARVYAALGRTDDARREWQIELSLKPEDNEGEADLKEARAQLDKFNRPLPQSPAPPPPASQPAGSARPAA